MNSVVIRHRRNPFVILIKRNPLIIPHLLLWRITRNSFCRGLQKGSLCSAFRQDSFNCELQRDSLLFGLQQIYLWWVIKFMPFVMGSHIVSFCGGLDFVFLAGTPLGPRSYCASAANRILSRRLTKRIPIDLDFKRIPFVVDSIGMSIRTAHTPGSADSY